MVYFFYLRHCFCIFTAVTWLTGARLLEGGCTVTALTWRIVMTRCCYDTSTDLTPERHVYIPPHPPYIDPHTTSFVNHTQYLVPRRHVL